MNNTSVTNEDLASLIDAFATITAQRFDQIDERFDKVENRLDKVEDSLTILDAKMTTIESNSGRRLDILEDKMQVMYSE